MRVSERTVDRALVAAAKRRGALAIKLTTLGRYGSAGWPDRLLLRDGRAFFVEVKSSRGRSTPLQLRRAAELDAAGFPVWIVRTTATARELVETIVRRERDAARARVAELERDRERMREALREIRDGGGEIEYGDFSRIACAALAGIEEPV